MARNPKGKPDANGVKALIDDAQQRFIARDRRNDRMALLINNQLPIGFPDGTPNPSLAYSGMAAQQVGLMAGFTDDYPLLGVYTSEKSQKRKDMAARIESAHTSVWPLLEAQAGQSIHSMVFRDQLTYGYGVDRLAWMPAETMGDAPERKDYEDAKGYLQARNDYMQEMGPAGGQLPVVWRHVDARCFWWEEAPESGGLAIAIEQRMVPLATIVNNPRYKKGAKELHDAANKLDTDTDDGNKRMMARVRLTIVETPQWCTTYLSPDIVRPGDGDSQQWLANAYQTGEIAAQYPNPLGRVSYTVTKGLATINARGELEYRGICHDMASGIEAKDHILSWRLTALKTWLFPPFVLETQIDPNGQALAETESGELKAFSFKPVFHDVKPLPPGITGRFLVPEQARDLIPLAEELDRLANLHGIAPALLDPQTAENGYLYNSVVNTTQKRFGPWLRGVATAHERRAELLHDIIRAHGEPLIVGANVDQRSHSVETLSLQPDDLDMPYILKAKFGVSKQNDLANQIAAYNQAVANGSPWAALSPETAYETILERTDWEQENERKALAAYLNSEKVRDFIIQKTAETELPEIDKEVAQKQGTLDAADLQNAPPALIQALMQTMQPGSPGYEALQAELERRQGERQGQQKEQQQAAAPQGPAPIPMQGGRPAGAAPGRQPTRAAGGY